MKPIFGPQWTALLVSGNKYMRLLSLTDLELIHKYDREDLRFTGAAAFTADEQFILAATDDQKMLAIETNLDGKAQEKAVFSTNSSVTGIAFSSKYSNFVTVGEECTYWSVDSDILGSFNV